MKTGRYRPREEKMRGKYFKRSYKSHKKDMERKPTELRPKRTHSGRPCEQNTKKAAFGYGNPIVFTKFAREGILEQMTNDPTKNQQTGRRRIVPGIDCLENYFAIFDTIVDTTPETLNGLMFATCQAGSCCFSVDLKQHTLRPNDTLLMLPGQTIRPGGHSEDFKGRFMFISSEFMADVTFRRRQNAFAFFIVRDNPLLHLSQDDMQMFVQYHDFIRKRMREAPDASRVEIVRHLLGALFYEFLAIDNHLTDDRKVHLSRKDDICRQFLDLLIKHYRENRSVSFYADKLFITPKYLSATLRAVVGKRAGELIDDYVLLQAKVLLKTTDLTVQQISEELNFANQSFFARYFKHLTGISPTAYRND